MRCQFALCSLFCRCKPWTILCLTGSVYLFLRLFVPYSLRELPLLAPLSRLAVTAAPLLAVVFLLPLPVAIWRASRERRLVRKMASIEAPRAMRWDELEMAVRHLFEQCGYTASRIGGAGADGGVDVIVRKAGRTLLVQCKQWHARQVSASVVRELAGVVVHGADGGVIVTCGAFTREARSFASRAGIVLVDGFELLRMRHSPGLSLPASPVLASGVPVAPANTVGCPKCGAIMIRRSAKSGRAARRQFLGCSNYPLCCGTRPL